jgi:hypothetical protein
MEVQAVSQRPYRLPTSAYTAKSRGRQRSSWSARIDRDPAERSLMIVIGVATQGIHAKRVGQMVPSGTFGLETLSGHIETETMLPRAPARGTISL